MVSVVIPTYGRPYKIKQAVDSAFSQSVSDIEVIVVDDNGKGTTEQISTKEIIDSAFGSKVIYIAHEKNLGGCAARNTGIDAAIGEFIAFLDDDDVWAPDYLENMIACFIDPEIGAAYCDFYSYDGTYITTAPEGMYHPSGDIHEDVLKGFCPVSTSLVVARKSALVRCGCFDVNVKSFQDYDMWLNMSRYYSFAYCDEKLLKKYEGVGEQTSKNPQKRRAGFEYICNKWEPTFNQHEKELFEQFKKKHYKIFLYNTIFYKKEKKENYRSELKEYKACCDGFGEKVRLYIRLYLPKKLVYKLTMRRAVKKGNASYATDF